MNIEFIIFEGNNTKWNEGISKFENSNMHQIYEWGEFKNMDGWSILRLIGVLNNNEVSYSQILHKKKYGINIIYIPGGPVGNLELWFKSINRFIFNHFGFFSYCKISSSSAKDNKIINIIKKNRWKKPFFKVNPEDTFLLKLDKDSDKVRQACSNNWRYGLNRSQKNNLKLKLENNPQAERTFNIYKEMEKNKNLPQTYSLKQIKNIFNFLKNKIIYYECYNDKNELIAIRGAIYNNNKAWEVLAASTIEARKYYAPYTTEWALLEHCCKIGINFYDFTGADKKNNPGVYFFKKGTGAKEIRSLGEWEFSQIPFFRYIIYLRFKFLYIAKIIFNNF